MVFFQRLFGQPEAKSKPYAAGAPEAPPEFPFEYCDANFANSREFVKFVSTVFPPLACAPVGDEVTRLTILPV